MRRNSDRIRCGNCELIGSINMRDLHTKNIDMNLYSYFKRVRPRYAIDVFSWCMLIIGRLGAYIVDGRALTRMA
jgi:hypothetical protein